MQDRQKWPHQKPSRKLNDQCISRIYVTKFKSGKVKAKYVSAHSNHTTGPIEDASLSLPATATIKLSVGISIESNYRLIRHIASDLVV